MAKHRAIPPMSFRTVFVLAVAGAIASAVLISALGGGQQRTATPAAQATAAPVAAPSAVLPTSAPFPSAPVSPPAVSPAASLPAVAAATRVPTSPSSRAPSPAPRPPASTLTARYRVTSQWDNGFVAAIEVRNVGTQPASWVVEVAYPTDVVITGNGVWNATVERTASAYRFRANLGAPLAAGQSVQFGYLAGAPRGAGRPSRCTVNDRTCE